MSGTKEYVVALVKGIDYNQFWTEIENPSSGLPHIPNRPVQIINNRNAMDRLCHYALTDDEAAKLENDPRVIAVEIPIEQRTDIKISLNATQSGNFTKPTYGIHNGNNINWGLVRHSKTTNVYGTGDTAPSASYLYTADGTDVDIVITDSGIQGDHPEFQDSAGNSRIKLRNWANNTVSAVPWTDGYFRDEVGHGTHVAATAAGKTQGWAKNANIYPLKIDGLGFPGGTTVGGISDFSLVFDYIKTFHTAKATNPYTGVKNPTVVNASWQLSLNGTYSDIGITHINYRGSNVAAITANVSKGMISSISPAFSAGYSASVSIPVPPSVIEDNTSPPFFSRYINVALEELIASGVTVCLSAGNNAHKIDVANGIDYNNQVTYNSLLGVSTNGIAYYHRGSSPIHANAIVVGALAYTPHSSTLDKKAPFSAAGPGVDVYAAGEGIRSAWITSDTAGSAAYGTTSFRQATSQGTSMASPQIAGMCALYLQSNPTATPAQVKSWLLGNATVTMYTSGSNSDYTNTSSIWGGNARVAYANVQITTQSTPAPTTPPTPASSIISLVSTGRKQIFPLPLGFSNPITAYLWGGGGGGGGNDTGTGGAGAAGQLIKITFNANVGDILEVSVGTGGGRGSSGVRGTGGGAAGSSFIDDTPTSYGGGRGGNAGGSGTSGGGGGGGGATVISLFRAVQADRIIVAVAGGGAGGGGAGNRGSRNGKAASTTGSGANAFRTGSNGEDHSGDGGGGGGGGGGYYGGIGGAISASYDEGANPGITGSSWANPGVTLSSTVYAGTATAPVNIDGFDIGPYANGGTATQAGGTGFAILNLVVSPFPFIKVGGSWVKVEAGWVKEGGQWRAINGAYHKVDNVWRRISNAETLVFTNANVGINYGSGGTRSFPVPEE